MIASWDPVADMLQPSDPDLRKPITQVSMDTTYKICANAGDYVARAPLIQTLQPASGPVTGGTTITMTGQFLGGDVQDIEGISIFGQPCTNILFSHVDDGSPAMISCTTPALPPAVIARKGADPLSADIVVVTKGARRGQSIPQFTYLRGEPSFYHR